MLEQRINEAIVVPVGKGDCCCCCCWGGGGFGGVVVVEGLRDSGVVAHWTVRHGDWWEAMRVGYCFGSGREVGVVRRP